MDSVALMSDWISFGDAGGDQRMVAFQDFRVMSCMCVNILFRSENIYPAVIFPVYFVRLWFLYSLHIRFDFVSVCGTSRDAFVSPIKNVVLGRIQ